MTDRRVDLSKMYAHVYFDRSGEGKLGIAVYSVASIPGFASKPSEQIKSDYGVSSAKDLFLSSFPGREALSPEEIQSGKVFTLEEIGEKIPEISTKGKALSENEDSEVVINLDDPDFWARAIPNSDRFHATDIRDREVQILSDPAKALELAQESGDQEKIKEAKEALEMVFSRLYIVVSRILNPTTGPKQFPKRNTPPALIYSGMYGVAYYPGFRGSPYMSETPKLDSKSVHTHRDEPGKYWHEIIVPNVSEAIDSPISSVRTEVLDQISEVLARLLFKQLRRGNTLELRREDFNQAMIALRDKATTLLGHITEEDTIKTASAFIGTWIDLYTGKTFKSLSELLASKKQLSQELAKAAGVQNK